MDFFGIGALELLVILVVIFLVMGPDRLPQISRKLGEFIAQARSSVNQVQDAFAKDMQISLDTPTAPAPSTPPASLTPPANSTSSQSQSVAPGVTLSIEPGQSEPSVKD